MGKLSAKARASQAAKAGRMSEAEEGKIDAKANKKLGGKPRKKRDNVKGAAKAAAKRLAHI